MKRASGVLMHLSSLWGDYSIGSFGKSCKRWIDFLSDSGFSYWQTLPFCMPDEYNSPYKSYSAFSGNPYFIDLEILNKQGLITDEELLLAKQKSPYLCEFDRLRQDRLNLLKKASWRFKNVDAINNFYKTHPKTLEFCKFMALKEANNYTEWQAWTVFDISKKEYYEWQFIEYEFFIQWAEIKNYANKKGVKIIGDIPIYVDADSADVWANPTEFQLDKNNKPKLVAGVPPDYFSEDGQVWGNPLYDYKAMKSNGFKWWKDRVSFYLELFDGVRIDHFRGFESYFTMPYGSKTAKNGKWVKGPGMALINEIKKVAGDKLIIAEDLGEITPAVRKLVDKSGFPGMRVLQFGFLGENSTHLPHNYDNNSVAYTGTHDNNTLLGYVWELDNDTRTKLLNYFDYQGDWNNCYDHLIRAMFRSHAGLVIFPVQDLLKYGADTRLNTPGSADKNWAYRITESQFESLNASYYRSLNSLYNR